MNAVSLIQFQSCAAQLKSTTPGLIGQDQIGVQNSKRRVDQIGVLGCFRYMLVGGFNHSVYWRVGGKLVSWSGISGVSCPILLSRSRTRSPPLSMASCTMIPLQPSIHCPAGGTYNRLAKTLLHDPGSQTSHPQPFQPDEYSA